MSAVTVLARSGEGAKAGPIGLAVILLLCIACYFLFKSMSKHMRQVRENFPVDEPAGPPTTRPTQGTGRSADDAGPGDGPLTRAERTTPAIAPPTDQSTE